jgi:2-oxoglutarate dehydrogenase E1 component
MKTQKTMRSLWKDSYLSGGADAYLDDLYEAYLNHSPALMPEWRQYFDDLTKQTAEQGKDISHADIQAYFKQLAKEPAGRRSAVAGDDALYTQKQEKVIDFINAYRNLGHLQATIDPLGLYQGVSNPVLELSHYGFTDHDLDIVFDVGSFTGLGVKKKSASLREIYQALRDIYCGSIGIEYMHIIRLEETAWLQQRIEQGWLHFSPSRDEKLRIFDRLIAADTLEKYIGSKYVGQKRFSLEGGDSLIPMLDIIVSGASENGIREIVIGMAHRGRLNVLANVVGKKSKTIFDVFEGKGEDEEPTSGDVKYHLGFSSDVKTKWGPIHLALAFNPSHLEIVAPVVQGSVRSRQRRRRDTDRKLVMPIQIHGDAAFSGQGVVMESFNMSQARWFSVGGSIHIVINNQVGFTISNPQDARSGLYCTDVAKMISPPILHVNANDPEAVFFVGQLAVDYRAKFKKDIIIDLVCYRRHGHNETDEPSATQPLMYKVIKSLPPASALYAKQLVSEGIIDGEKEQQLMDYHRKLLDEGKSSIELVDDQSAYEYNNAWVPFVGNDWRMKVQTGVPLKKLKALAHQLEILPEGFVLQPQVKKMLEARHKMTEGELPLNWGYAEIMAYATLLDQGYPIRLCGQDACRGTFAHRHAVLHDQNTDQIYIPLSHLAQNQVQINLVDSLLSEEAVMAFEYGFASAEPNNLVIWEAQFGDFANGAQVVIDQFISSGEQKWGRLCGLVLLLPHGYDGMGPEHSSARLERYLQLCAQQNMQVCVPTTPAQIFHLLRRQMIRPYRKPLIIMSPKSLLRSPVAISSLEDLTTGEYQLIIPEIDKLEVKNIDRLVLCSGKVYYDLLEKRRELKLLNVAIIRLEQLYPFPNEELRVILEPYQQVTHVIWCQEEPENQGAWYNTQHHLKACLNSNQTLSYVGRPASASPAVGSAKVHLRQQEALVGKALR